MDEREFRECLKIHGYLSSEEDSETESKLQLDDIYEAFKPPPILIDETKHTIIEIGAPKTSERPDGEKLSKSQKKRRRKKLLQADLRRSQNSINGESSAVEGFGDDASSCGNSSVTEEVSVEDTSLGDGKSELEVENSEGEAKKKIEKDSTVEKEEQSPPTTVSFNFETESFTVKNNVIIDKDSYNISEEVSSTSHVAQGAKKKRNRRKKGSKNELSISIQEEVNVPNPKKNEEESKKQINANSLKNVTVVLNTREWNQKFLSLFMSCEELFNYLMAFIEHNPEDALGIFRNVQCYLSKLQTLGIRLTKGTNCIATLIKRIALRYRSFLEKLKEEVRIEEAVDKFFYDLNTIIVQTVLKESDIMQPMNTMENFVFDCLSVVLNSFSSIIAMTVCDRTEVERANPFAVLKPEIGFYSGNMLPFINLANVIWQRRLDSEAVASCSGEITVDKPLEEGKKLQEVDLSSSYEGVRRQSEFWEDAGYVLQISPCTLDPVVIDDLAKNRRYFYDESYSGVNWQSWQTFRNFYLNECIRKYESYRQKESKPQVQGVVVENLTKNQRYSGVNFEQSYENFYFIENVTSCESNFRKFYVDDVPQNVSSNSDSTSSELHYLDEANSDEELLCVSDKNINLIEYPILWLLHFCDIKKVVGFVVFMLVLKEAMLWFLVAFFSFVDLVCFMILLLYVCTYFVIKY